MPENYSICASTGSSTHLTCFFSAPPLGACRHHLSHEVISDSQGCVRCHPLSPQYRRHHIHLLYPPVPSTNQGWHPYFLGYLDATLESFISHSRWPLLWTGVDDAEETCLPVPIWSTLHSWHLLCCIEIHCGLALYVRLQSPLGDLLSFKIFLNSQNPTECLTLLFT